MSDDIATIPRRSRTYTRQSRPGKPAPEVAAIKDLPPERITRRSAGSPSPHSEEFLDPETGKPIKRRSRKDDSDNVYDIPQRYRKPGWDYEWKTMTVQGQAVDGSVLVDIADGGWRAVRPDEMPGFMPSGFDGLTIDRKTQRLFMRPMHLTKEARQEDQERARQQKADKFRQAQMTDPGAAPKHVNTLTSSYEALPREMTEIGDIQEV